MIIETKFSNGDVVWRAYTNWGPTSQEDCPECGGKGSLAIEGKSYRYHCPRHGCDRGKINVYGPIPLAETLTVGQVRVEISDSPGDGEGSHGSNFGPVRERKEEYMMIQTGIGSGSVYPVEDLFHTEAEALERGKVKVLEALEHQRKQEEYRERQRQQNLRDMVDA